MVHLKVITEKVVCKVCGSPRVVKHGSYKGKQKWLCRDCGRVWTDNKAAVGGKLPAECVAYTLGSYYNGESLNSIRNNLKQQYGIYPSGQTVYNWVDKYTKKLVASTRTLRSHVGNTWVADESYVRIDQRKDNPSNVENPYEKGRKGKWVIFWDIIDADTRFLLASLVTTTRNIEDARKLMVLAARRAGKTPRVVVTDKLKAYIEGIERAYGSASQHKQGGPFDVVNNTNLIERFHGSLKARTKVMRGLRSLDSTKLFTEGWLAYYNFLRPHMSLDGRTPAEVAGIECPFHDWSSFIGVRNPVQIDEEIVRGTLRTLGQPKKTIRHKPVKKVRKTRKQPIPQAMLSQVRMR